MVTNIKNSRDLENKNTDGLVNVNGIEGVIEKIMGKNKWHVFLFNESKEGIKKTEYHFKYESDNSPKHIKEIVYTKDMEEYHTERKIMENKGYIFNK